MQSENTAGAEKTTVEPEEKSGIQNLAELMGEETESDGSEDAGASGDASGSEEAALTKFNDLAGKLGLELEDLYKLEVSQATDGSPVTVENLKDHYARQDDIDLRELEFEERRTQHEAEMMRAQEELREIMAALPEKAIKPEVLQKVREKHEAQVRLERQRALELIPEWKDEKTRTADIEGMVEHLQQYGYPVNYLERVADHRQIKYIRDNWLREKRIRAALEKVRAGKPNPTSRNKASNKAPLKKPLAGVSRGREHPNKLKAVFSQLE